MSIELPSLIERRSEELLHNSSMFATGRRGRISITMIRDNAVVIKQGLESVSHDVAVNEATYTRAANKVGVGPDLYYYDEENGAVFRSFVHGARFDDWMRCATSLGNDPVPVLRRIFEQCGRLDDEGIHRPELSNPHKDILVDEGIPVIIDFERARYRPQPTNTLQFVECVLRRRYASMLGVDSREEKRRSLRPLMRSYKESGDASVREDIVDAVIGFVSG